MKYGYSFWKKGEPQLVCGEINDGRCFWKNKIGGELIGVSEIGIHDTKEEAHKAAMKHAVMRAQHSHEISMVHLQELIYLENQKHKL